MQPQSEKNRKTDRKPKSRKARRRQKEQQMKFLRQNSWLILLAVLVLVALILLAGIAQYIYAQVALVEVGFGGLLKNALMLFLGYLPRSALGVLWQGIYWAVVALFWPVSSFAVILCSLWLPCLLNLMAIYPALDKSFDLEKTIKAMRDAQLNSENEDK